MDNENSARVGSVVRLEAGVDVEEAGVGAALVEDVDAVVVDVDAGSDAMSMLSDSSSKLRIQLIIGINWQSL